MPHFRVSTEPPAISITGAALGPAVWPSLRLARAALHEGVDAAIKQANADRDRGIEALTLAAAEKIRDLRASRDAALKVREDKLPSDETTTAQAMGEIGRQVEAGVKEEAA